MIKPRTILFISSRSDIAGGEKYLLSVMRHLDRDRFYPMVVLPGSGPFETRLEQLGIEVAIVEEPRGWLKHLKYKRELAFISLPVRFHKRYVTHFGGLTRVALDQLDIAEPKKIRARRGAPPPARTLRNGDRRIAVKSIGQGAKRKRIEQSAESESRRSALCSLRYRLCPSQFSLNPLPYAPCTLQMKI